MRHSILRLTKRQIAAKQKAKPARVTLVGVLRGGSMLDDRLVGGNKQTPRLTTDAIRKMLARQGIRT